jgi:hypothetical protein
MGMAAMDGGRMDGGNPMSIDGVSRASTGDAFALLTLKKGMEQEQSQMAQLLQALPPAPQPAHLGGHVDVRA